MTMKTTLLATVLLAAAPSLAFAKCSVYGHHEASMNCAAGTVYDAEKETCVAVTG